MIGRHRLVIFALCIAAAVSFVCAEAAAKRVAGRGDGTISLFRPVKNERATFRYRTSDGSYDQAVLDEIAHFFRCRLTDQVHPIDPELIEILDAIEDRFSGHEVRLISAYRSPTRNNIMRASGRRVARQSYHMDGMAADIEVAGISNWKVRDFAYSLGRGGVGYYRGRPFVHVDIGPLRTWGWRPPSPGRARPAAATK